LKFLSEQENTPFGDKVSISQETMKAEVMYLDPIGAAFSYPDAQPALYANMRIFQLFHLNRILKLLTNPDKWNIFKWERMFHSFH
jgi:hypothetical protein